MLRDKLAVVQKDHSNDQKTRRDNLQMNYINARDEGLFRLLQKYTF